VTAEYTGCWPSWPGPGLAQGGRRRSRSSPPAVGLGLAEHGEKTAAENVARICAAARSAGHTVTLDMEDHARVDPTLRIAAQVRTDYPDLGVVIQSVAGAGRWRDCAALAQAGSRVRLCKGAYDAPDEVAYPARHDVDRSYDPRVAGADGRPGLPDDRHPRPAAAPDRGRPGGASGPGPRTATSTRCSTGSRPAEQRRLAATGARLRVYLPYGLGLVQLPGPPAGRAARERRVLRRSLVSSR